MQQAASLSFWRLQTLLRPSAFEIQKRDSSENNTSCHLCLVHCKWVLAHAKRCWRCLGVNSGHLNSRLVRRPFSHSLQCTVAERIRGLCLPGVSLAVDAVVLNRLHKCCKSSYDDLVGRLLLLVVLAEDDRTHCSWFETSVWGVQQYFDGNWIVKQLFWLICLFSTYQKLGCDHYYSDVAFLKPNKTFTIANSADIWLFFSQVGTVLSKSGFKKFILSVHDLHVQEILFLKFNRYLSQVIRHIRKFTGIFWRSTLLTITFNQALFFWGNFSKKKKIF